MIRRRVNLLLVVAMVASLVGCEGERRMSGPLVLPAFEEAMGERAIQWGWWSKDDQNWVGLLEGLYERHLGKIHEGEGENVATRIPKIVHQVWLGGEPLPPQFAAWRETWVAAHPDWKHYGQMGGHFCRNLIKWALAVMWTEEEADQLPMLDRDQYDNAQNVGAKSDVLRMEALYRFGGLYVDIDFECLKSFDFLHEQLDFYASLSNVGALEVSNGIVAATKRHPIIRRVITTRSESLPAAEGASQLEWIGMPTISNSGPGRFTRVTMTALLNETTAQGEAGSPLSVEEGGLGRVVVFPTNFFFPLPNSVVSADAQARERLRHKVIQPETLALHHWASSWLKHEMGYPVWAGTGVETPSRRNDALEQEL